MKKWVANAIVQAIIVFVMSVIMFLLSYDESFSMIDTNSYTINMQSSSFRMLEGILIVTSITCVVIALVKYIKHQDKVRLLILYKSFTVVQVSSMIIAMMNTITAYSIDEAIVFNMIVVIIQVLCTIKMIKEFQYEELKLRIALMKDILDMQRKINEL